MTATEILVDWLKEHGYDGLYNVDIDCACRLSDLCPCDNPLECKAGVFHETTDNEKMDDGLYWAIGPKEGD